MREFLIFTILILQSKANRLEIVASRDLDEYQA